MKISTMSIIAGAACAVLGSAAMADTVNVQFLGSDQGRNVKVITASSTMNVFAGQLIHRFSNGTGEAAFLNGDRVTFCTDLLEYVTTTPKTYTLVGLDDVPGPSGMGLDKANAIADLYQYAAGTQSRADTNDDFAAAFQLAIWEIVFDFNALGGRSSVDVTAGGFKAKKTDGTALSSPITGYLNTLFNAIGSYSRNDPGSLRGVTRSGSQDQIVEIPLPSPGLLAGAGLFSVAAVRRRRA
jgi:hypothetical protein